MTAVISFMHLSPLTAFNWTASGTRSAYYCYKQCSFHASLPSTEDQWFAPVGPMGVHRFGAPALASCVIRVRVQGRDLREDKQ